MEVKSIEKTVDSVIIHAQNLNGDNYDIRIEMRSQHDTVYFMVDNTDKRSQRGMFLDDNAFTCVAVLNEKNRS